MDEFFRQHDPQYAAEHPEEHAAKEEIYENLMAGRISALDEKLAALGQTQEDYLPSEIEKFKDATGYEEFLDVDPQAIREAIENPDQSHVDEMLSFAEQANREYEAELYGQQAAPTPDDRETGETVRTPRGTFHVTDMSREQMEVAGWEEPPHTALSILAYLRLCVLVLPSEFPKCPLMIGWINRICRRFIMASIKRRRGKYHVVYYYLNEDGEKKQKWESFDTKAEAKHRKAEIEYKQGSRTFIAPSKTTVAAFLEDFVSLYGTKKWSPSTYEANTGLIRNYINPKLGSTLMQDVTSIAADRFISALQRTKCPTYKNRYSKTEYMTPANIERINKLLRCAFGQAVRWDIIAKNPFENTTLPKIKRKPREIWDAATIRKALDECKDGRLYVAINLSFACSLRIGEIVGLTWDNIHISDADIASDNAYLCVEKELVRVREDSLAVLGEEEIIKKFPRTMYLEDASTVIVLKTPKTESSVRKVWMPKTVAYILREWKASQDKQKEFLGSEYLDYNLVVALPNGRPCEETVISNAFRRLKRDAQLPDVVFHSLRHSSTTYKLKLNHGDIKATQGDTGHSQADMVTKVYAHILDEDRKVNAQKFESAFYANPDLRGVQAPAEQAPALDVQSIILQFQQSPELLSALTSLISNQGCK